MDEWERTANKGRRDEEPEADESDEEESAEADDSEDDDDSKPQESDEEESDDEESDKGESDEGESDNADTDDNGSQDTEADDEVQEDDNPDYGEPVVFANLPGLPTVHALLVVYGKDIEVDGDVRSMRDFFRRLQSDKIANVRERLLHGADATAKGTLKALSLLRPGPDDVAWFFYSGHGCMSEGKRLLCTREQNLRRDAVVGAIANTAARMSVVLTDCCAVEVGKLEPEEMAGGAMEVDSASRLRDLLRRYRGCFDVSSSSSYQYSFGGVFTPTLIDQVLLGNTPSTWEEVFQQTQERAMQTTDSALPADAKKRLQREGKRVEEHQRPVAFSLPALA